MEIMELKAVLRSWAMRPRRSRPYKWQWMCTQLAATKPWCSKPPRRLVEPLRGLILPGLRRFFAFFGSFSVVFGRFGWWR